MGDLKIKLTFIIVVCTEPKRLFSIQRNIVKVLGEEGRTQRKYLKNRKVKHSQNFWKYIFIFSTINFLKFASRSYNSTMEYFSIYNSSSLDVWHIALFCSPHLLLLATSGCKCSQRNPLTATSFTPNQNQRKEGRWWCESAVCPIVEF